MRHRVPARAFRLLAASALLVAPAVAAGRDVLGVFQRWGAFRDAEQKRCFAIAQPLAGGWQGSPWRPFAAVGYWPQRGLRGQINIRLSHQLAAGSGATLAIGDQRFALAGGGADVWARDRKADAAIIAAMRSGRTMSIAGRARAGGTFTDRYDLRGAATAIDAAALGCARLR
ncbi:hypothetical protein SLG_33560 [Sphingobium sp. SYK-6]|uniref:hypothetical protein n=1 Tax=Sphingobium sp. (strain NBRC 103272 / SYK-6) TaxID=627192 RepID=UPI00022778EC|nr:hypothetical protein [Sphingobium sp. SYK-6]BAK68031.1 hypothetical protein SLG_33560 [Sphingobium sp. SYK-6]